MQHNVNQMISCNLWVNGSLTHWPISSSAKCLIHHWFKAVASGPAVQLN